MQKSRKIQTRAWCDFSTGHGGYDEREQGISNDFAGTNFRERPKNRQKRTGFFPDMRFYAGDIL